MALEDTDVPMDARFQMHPDISPALRPYATLVRFLGEMLGPQTEVLLHDTSDFAHSIVAIANFHISGRSVGGPATDLVLRIWQSRGYEHSDYLVNYRSGSGREQPLRSSTYFIRDDKQQVIGLLCFNIDNASLLEVRRIVDSLVGFSEEVSIPVAVDENLTPTLDELTSTSINKVLRESNVEPARMTKDEKLAFVERLVDMGVFLVRGSVSQVAQTLQVSEPSIYRYINTVTKSASRARR